MWDQNGNSGQINKYNSSGVTLTVSSIANEGQSDVGIYVNTSSGADAEAYVCHWAAESEL